MSGLESHRNDNNLENCLENFHGDPLHLQNSNHPGMMLTGAKLNGANYLPWRRSVKIAIVASVTNMDTLSNTHGKEGICDDCQEHGHTTNQSFAHFAGIFIPNSSSYGTRCAVNCGTYCSWIYS